MVFSCRQVQQTQRSLFMRFLLSLVADPVSLRAHVNNNARIPWFHKRIKFKPNECSIISTTWLFSRYCDWRDSLGRFPVGSVEEACSSQYTNPSGEQKSFTLFVRQNVLKKVGESQRLKGQDTPEGNSEYFIVIPGGIETLDEALRAAPMPGSTSVSSSPVHNRSASASISNADRQHALTRGTKRSQAQQEDYPSPLPKAKQKGFRSSRARPDGLRILADVSANIL